MEIRSEKFRDACAFLGSMKFSRVELRQLEDWETAFILERARELGVKHVDEFINSAVKKKRRQL